MSSISRCLLAVLLVAPFLAQAKEPAAASNIASAVSKRKFDAAFSVCQAVVPTTHRDFAVANMVGPASPIIEYFFSRGVSMDSLGPWKDEVIGQPKHGELRLTADKGYVYRPNTGYLGPDQIAYAVEVKGKKFKVIETIWVADVAPEYGGCPADYKLPRADTQ